MRLINENTFPPGGWSYINPVTNWHVPDPRSMDLLAHVAEVISHRRANKLGQPTDFHVVKQEIIEFTCQRLIRDLPANQWKAWVSMAEPLPLPDVKKKGENPTVPARVAPVNPRSGFAGIAMRLVGVADGAAVMKDWVGDGLKTVDQETAERRSATCAVCDQNVDSNFFDLFTGPIASVIKRISEVKSHLKLETKEDLNLGVCDVCGCHLRTKVWVPIMTIRKHTARDFLRKPPGHCWMNTES
jgi:hypothetical protein